MLNSGNPPGILRPVAKLSRKRSEPNSALSSGSNAKHKTGLAEGPPAFLVTVRGIAFRRGGPGRQRHPGCAKNVSFFSKDAHHFTRWFSRIVPVKRPSHSMGNARRIMDGAFAFRFGGPELRFVRATELIRIH